MQLPLVPLHQGRTNGCGTTALAMALNCLLALQNRPGHFSRQQLDAGHRAFDGFSAPGMLLRLARRHGFYGEILSDPDWEAVVRHLRAGHPLLLLHSVDGRVSGLHYELIYGLNTDGGGHPRLRLCDPASGSRPLREIDPDEFNAALRTPVTCLGIDMGLRATVLVFSAMADLVPGGPVHFWLHAGGLINRLLAGLEGILGSKFKERPGPVERVPKDKLRVL